MTNVNCHYGPPGNKGILPFGIGRKPFRLGEPCTDCNSGHGWCDNGLCIDCPNKDCECPIKVEIITSHRLWIIIWKCLNCGILDAENCNCNCPPGWDGIACQRPCDNLDQKCGADIEGISADLCPVYGGFWLSKVIFNFNSRGPQIGVVIHSFNRHG